MGGKRSFVRRAIDKANHRLANTLAAAPQPASGSSDGKCIHALIQVHTSFPCFVHACSFVCIIQEIRKEELKVHIDLDSRIRVSVACMWHCSFSLHTVAGRPFHLLSYLAPVSLRRQPQTSLQLGGLRHAWSVI